MLKKIYAAILAVTLSAAPFVSLPVSATETDGKLALLNALGIFQGYEDGSYRLENNLTRAEFTKVAVCASENRKAVSGALAVSPYADVPHTLWSAPYIRLAAQKGYVNGYLDSTFRPDANITYAEATAVFLRLLGYQNSDFGAAWPQGHMHIAEDIGLCDGIILDYNAPITRRDTVTLLYNLLNETVKGSANEYLSVLGYTSHENTVVIATAGEDTAVPSDKVVTSAGTYKKGKSFSPAWIGRTGELFLEDGDTVLSFVPKTQTYQFYTVTDTRGADLVLDGTIYNWDDSMKVYYKSGTITYGTAFAEASTGNTFTVFYDSDGAVEYGFLQKTTPKATEAVSRQTVAVYSVLSDGIVTYTDGTMQKVKLEDGVPLYEDGVSAGGLSKSKLSTGDILEIVYDTDGDVEYVILDTDSVEGPCTALGNSWFSQFPISDTTVYMRNGKSVSASDIRDYDILYYSGTLNMILAYSEKVTGIYKTTASSAGSNTVNVSGTNYTLEGLEAFGKLSTSGLFKSGDTITLLLGRNGEVADILSSGTEGALSTRTIAVYSILNDGIISYNNGNMEKVKVEDGVPLYKGDTPSGTLIKSTLQMGDILQVVYDDDGDVSHVILDTDGVDGPYTVQNSAWTAQFPITPATAIMRNGQKVASSDIETYDILYYSEALNMILAYSDKITGVYKSASPSKDTPSTVNISGTNYAIEGLNAFNKLATGGAFSYGDTVTLLLGREGDVADVLTSTASADVVGYVQSVGTKLYETALGEPYSGYMLSITDAGGNTYEFEADRDYDTYLNHVVSLSFSDGKASAKPVEAGGISGKVDADALTLGSAALSPQVKILEVYGPDTYVGGRTSPVFLQRLNGVTLTAGDILHVARDSQNRISELILDDVTGDMHSYGVVISAKNNSVGMSVSGSYSYIINGSTGTYQTSGSSFSIGNTTPAQFTYSGGKLHSIRPLSQLSGVVKSITPALIQYADGSRYDISEADIYLKGATYTYSQLKASDVSADAYTLRAYYDKAPSDGGAIRIIIAEKK